MFILYGVRNGEWYPTQHGGTAHTGDSEVPVAIFSSVDEGVDYILENTLKNPNYSKSQVFFKGSLLEGFDKAYMDRKDIPVFQNWRDL